MTIKTKLRQQGGSLTIMLPKEMTDQLKLKAGDEVHLVPGPEGITVRPYDPLFEDAMKADDWVARRYRNVLKALADA